jgi:hypothetical protein
MISSLPRLKAMNTSMSKSFLNMLKNTWISVTVRHLCTESSRKLVTNLRKLIGEP